MIALRAKRALFEGERAWPDPARGRPELRIDSVPPLRPSFPCPVCGEVVPANAKACPGCGACDRSGWSGDPYTDGLALPDEEFDYKRFAAEEFGEEPRKSRWQWVWWVAAVVLLWAFLLSVLR